MTGSAPRADKRRHLRIPLKVELVEGDHWGPPEWAINISSGGIGLQARASLKVGSRVRLRFRLAPEDPLIETEADVVWCTEEADLTPGMHYFEMGLHFVSLSEEERSLIAAFVESDCHFWPDEDATLSGL
jgi:uncharacterized protein (TIGR02266 family)